MFAKLLKHEWHGAWRKLGGVSIGAMGVGVIGAVLLRVIMTYLGDSDSGLLASVLGTLLVFMVLALVAYMVGSSISLLHRFYKNKFTDEGYLTFTLPAKSWQIFLSSLVNTVLWMVIVSVVSTTAVGLIVTIGLGDVLRETVAEMRLYYDLDDLGGLIREVYGSVFPVMILSSVVSFLSSVTISLSCITMGCTFAKKHKILASIGVYYGLSMIMSVVNSMVSVALGLSASEEWALTAIYLAEMAIQLVVAVGGYFLSVYLMKRELNLP